MFTRRSGLWVPALLAVAGLAAYSRSFTVPFQFDDLPNLVESPRVHWTRLEWASVWPMLAYYRPLAQLTFGLNYWLGGLAVPGWHAVNLAVHVASAGLVWLLGQELLARAAWGDEVRRRRASLVAALLFLLHPVQTQAVTYIVQRMTSMSACLALLATWLWFRGRRAERPARWLGGAGLVWLAAVFTKENAIALPAVVAGVEALLGDDFSSWVRRRLQAVLVAAGAMGALGVALAVRYWPHIESEHARYGLSLGERLLTQPRVLGHYLSLLVWPLPSRLRVDYSFPVSKGLFDPPTTMLALLGLAALVGVAWWMRKRWPLFTLAVLWFLGNLVVENTVMPVDLVFEHRLYLPSFGPFLLAAVGLDRALAARPVRVWGAALPVLLLLGIWTDQRNEVWNDPGALHAQVLADAPNNPRSLMTVGAQAMVRGDIDGAERAFRAVLVVEPDNSRALGNLGNVARARGDAPGAEAWYRKSLAIRPREPGPLEGLGATLADRGRNAEAEEVFRKLVEYEPRNARGYANLGALRARARDHDGAFQWFARAVEIDPADPYPRVLRARALLLFGKLPEALAAAQEALAVDPRSVGGLEVRADCLERSGRGAEAQGAWRELLKAQPSRRGIHFKLGTALGEAGDLAGAEKEFEAELALGPHSGALNNLGNVWAERDQAKARAFYQRALEVDPQNTLAAENLRRLSPP